MARTSMQSRDERGGKLSIRTNGSWMFLGTGPALLITVSMAWAQTGNEQSPVATPTPVEAQRLDRVVVTARRREEILQDVPVSVTAFDAERVRELQADNIDGLQYSVPNLYLEKGDGGNAVIYIRGIGQNDSLAFADPGVGVYVDDVFIARSQAAFLELFDTERVEVLRGPQGTLYGRNTIGGAVKFVSKMPPSKFDAYLEAGAGDFDFYTVKGRIGGPLKDDLLRGKFAFSANQRDGYAKNLHDGKDDGDLKSFAWRGSLLFTPRDDLDITLSVDSRRDRPDTSRSPIRETAVFGFADPVGAPSTLSEFAPSTNPFRPDVNANKLSDLTAYGFTLKATWQISPDWALESISAYREMEFNLNLDTDGSPLPILDILVLQDQNQFSQELRASFDDGSGLAFTGGLYYFHDDDQTFSGTDNGSLSVFGFPITLFGLATSALADTDQTTDSYAAFADLSYALSDRFTANVGLRYTYEEKDSRRRFENFFDPQVSVITDRPPFLAGVGVPGVMLDGAADFDAFTPKFALSYQATPDAMLYVSASRGFKSGGFDGRGNSNFSFQPFDPETVWAYEAGLKSAWADGRMILNAAYFYNDYKDLQVTSFGADPVSGTFVSLFTNAAKARIQGVDLELTARPVDALTITATAGYLDAEYRKFETLVGGTATDVSDRGLVNSPKWNASLGATYQQALGNGLIGTAHADAGYRSKTYNEITASENLAQNKYAIVNALVSVKTEDARWEVQAGVRNLTDQSIRVQGFNLSEFPGFELSFFSAPRTYDFRVIYRY